MKTFFSRIHAGTSIKVMSAWGRKHYGITGKTDKAVCRKLAAMLMGKQAEGIFKPVVVRTRKGSATDLQAVPSGKPANKPAKRLSAKDFYDSWEWKTARYQALKKHGATCMLCGAKASEGAKICVDHIKPRALYPALELDLNNLQILCDECNRGKGRWDETDWRKRK